MQGKIATTKASEEENTVHSESVNSTGKGKKAVSFAPGVKPPAEVTAPKTESGAVKDEVKPPPLEGVIGRLEIRKSGLVQMRLGDGILLDVSPSNALR